MRVPGKEAATAKAAVDVVTSALADAPNGIALTELMALVRKSGLRIDGDDLGRLLRSRRADRVVQVSAFPERYALRRVPRQVHPSESVDAWQQAHDDLVLRLSDLSLDVLRLHVPVGQGALTARFDVVDDGKPAVWLSLVASGPQLLRALACTSPRTLSAGWRLPLRRLGERESLPALLVWPTPDPRAAAGVAVDVLRDGLGIVAGRVRLDAEVCTPAEADRRVGIHRAVRQARARRAGGGFARATCLKCGQPLTHPESLRVGVGPECRRYYGAEYFRAMASASSTDRLWFGAKKPRRWLAEILQDLGAVTT